MRFTLGGAPCRFAWSHPERGTAAVGFGEVDGAGVGPVDWLLGAPADELPGPWFGGFAFDAERPWAGFPAECWVLPRVLLWNGRTGPHAAAFGLPGTPVERLLAELDGLASQRPAHAMPVARLVSEDRAGWNGQIAAALSTPGLSKVVLARTATVEADGPWPEAVVLEALQTRHPSCRTYLWRGDDGAVLLGATPETLCEVRDGQLRTEALAGTSASERGVALLASEKDAREHQLVVDGVVAALGPHCTSVALGGRELRRVGPLTHLRTPVSAALRPGVDPLTAARALHPTPAVC
ncbi:MAG: chorismate-binding protein, partial [Myxococcaceae bacterium]|nr:chorismate-binding protein [Myxococcaceae bacterium]